MPVCWIDYGGNDSVETTAFQFGEVTAGDVSQLKMCPPCGRTVFGCVLQYAVEHQTVREVKIREYHKYVFYLRRIDHASYYTIYRCGFIINVHEKHNIYASGRIVR